MPILCKYFIGVKLAPNGRSISGIRWLQDLPFTGGNLSSPSGCRLPWRDFGFYLGFGSGPSVQSDIWFGSWSQQHELVSSTFLFLACEQQARGGTWLMDEWMHSKSRSWFLLFMLQCTVSLDYTQQDGLRTSCRPDTVIDTGKGHKDGCDMTVTLKKLKAKLSN